MKFFVAINLLLLQVAHGFVTTSYLREVKIAKLMENAEKMERPEGPDDNSLNEAERHQYSNYSHHNSGSELRVEPKGGVLSFVYNNITLSISLHRLQEFGVNESGEVFPLAPLITDPFDDHPHLEDNIKLQATDFLYTAIDTQTIGDVDFTHIAVQSLLNGVANFTLHVFQALNNGTATIWDKTYTFQPGTFKFSFELTNWEFCDSCSIPPHEEWYDTRSYTLDFAYNQNGHFQLCAISFLP